MRSVTNKGTTMQTLYFWMNPESGDVLKDPETGMEANFFTAESAQEHAHELDGDGGQYCLCAYETETH